MTLPWKSGDLADHLADGVVVLDHGGVIRYVNEAYAAMVRYPAADLLGRDGYSLLHRDDVGRARLATAYAAAHPDRAIPVRFRAERSDGSSLAAEMFGRPLQVDGRSWLTITVRPCEYRAAFDDVLLALGRPAAFEEVAAKVCDAVPLRWPNSGAAVTRSGSRTPVACCGVAPDLIERIAGERRSAVGLGAGPSKLDLTVLSAGGRAALSRAGVESMIVVPFSGLDGHAGVLWLLTESTIQGEQMILDAASDLAQLLSLAVARDDRINELERRGDDDALTGLLGRRAVLERMEALQSQARASGGTLVVAFGDLDDLKSLNDGHGHAMGDRALTAVAGHLRGAVPAGAVVGRLSGDEFVVAAIQDHPDAAPLHRSLERTVWLEVDAARMPLRMTFGYAVDDGSATVRELLHQADHAMYRSKPAPRALTSRSE